MNLSAIHKNTLDVEEGFRVVCDIGGYEFVSYSQGHFLTLQRVESCL